MYIIFLLRITQSFKDIQNRNFQQTQKGTKEVESLNVQCWNNYSMYAIISLLCFVLNYRRLKKTGVYIVNFLLVAMLDPKICILARSVKFEIRTIRSCGYYGTCGACVGSIVKTAWGNKKNHLYKSVKCPPLEINLAEVFDIDKSVFSCI